MLRLYGSEIYPDTLILQFKSIYFQTVFYFQQIVLDTNKFDAYLHHRGKRKII